MRASSFARKSATAGLSRPEETAGSTAIAVHRPRCLRRRWSTSAARSSTPRSASSPAQGFHNAPRLRRRRRGGRRLRARLPLLRLQGPDAERALHRALVAAARGRARGRRRRCPPREKLAAVAGFIIESYRHEPELMKVIIVEVTRAANSFGRTHLPEIRQAYDQIEKIVTEAQADGEFRTTSTPSSPRCSSTVRSSSCSPAGSSRSSRRGDKDFEHAKQLVVDTICGGLEPRPAVERSPASCACGRARQDSAPGPGPSRRREGRERPARPDRAARCGCSANCSGAGFGTPARLERRCASAPLPVPPERERTMDALMGDLERSREHLRHSDSPSPPRLRRHLQLRRRPAPRGRGDRLPLSGAVQGPHRRGRRRRADRRDDRPPGGGATGADRRPRALHLEPLRLRPPDRGPRLLQWGFNVAALDLRSFGLTELTSRRPRPRAGRRGRTSSPSPGT